MDTTPQEPADAGHAEADRLLSSLRPIPPQHATARTVEQYKRLRHLLNDQVGSPLWFEATTTLAAHLLECPHGDRSANVVEAEALYREAIATAEKTEGEPTWWAKATSGYANAVMSRPQLSRDDLADAIRRLEDLDDLSQRSDWAGPLGQASVLAQLARAHQLVQDDRIGHQEESILLQERAVQLLVDAAPGSVEASARGRARHNLATYYAKRSLGVASQNEDRAVRLLQDALGDRPAATAAVDRIRTLRALASLYPEWSGADSPAHAQILADQAADEAQRLEDATPAATARARGWAATARQKSALDADLAFLDGQAESEAVQWLNHEIQRHQGALATLSRETMPLQWAEWMGGIGRLLGRGPSFGSVRFVDETHECFAQALHAFDTDEHRELALRLLHAWGEFSHEIGDFPASLATHRRAVDISDQVLRSTADPTARLREIEKAKGWALRAAYAAAMAGPPEEAVSLAERERLRLQGDLFRARQTLAGPEPARSDMATALAHVQRLERQLDALDEHDPDVMAARVQARLGDFLFVDPSAMGSRRIDRAAHEPNPTAAERTRLGHELKAARRRVIELSPADLDNLATTTDAAAVAQECGCAVVYLLATRHGGAALAAFPEGRHEVLPLADLTSELVDRLAFGGDAFVGFLAAAVGNDGDELSSCLQTISSELGQALFRHLDNWLIARAIRRAVLIPLGSTGLLPLHVAAGADMLYSLAPSARAIRGANRPAGEGNLLLVADPCRRGWDPLPFAVVEARVLAARHRDTDAATALVGGRATRAAVVAASPAASAVHFGCHGRFRASDPLASELVLADGDQVTVGDVLAGAVDLSHASLVTILACQSGNAEFRRTPDERLSFPAAFLIAGVPNVVSTLWEVEDSASALFVLRFYELLDHSGMTSAEAVIRARSWLRDSSAQDLLLRVEELAEHLDAEDETARSAIARLEARLWLERPEAAPYRDPVHWSPFLHTGPA